MNEVYRSYNGGDSWEILDKGITKDAQANTAKFMSPNFIDLRISKSFKKDRTLFLGGFDGLFKTTDRGNLWTQMETLPLKLIAGLAVSPGTTNNAALAITTYGGGAYTTYDQGNNWTVNNYGLKRTRLSDIEFSPDYENDNVLFSSSRGYLLHSTGRENKWNRVPSVYNSWRKKLYSIAARLKMPDSLLKYIKNSFYTRADKIYEPFATDIAISPEFASDKTVLFATRVHGIYKYINGEITTSIIWDAMGQLVRSLVISPDYSYDKTIFAGLPDSGVYKSADGGDTWQAVNNGLTLKDKKQQSIEYTKHYIELVISPHYKIDETVYVSFSQGLFKTTNGGGMWKRIEKIANVKSYSIIGLAISPDYKNDQTVIVSLKGRGLYKSENGGNTFHAIAADLIRNNHEIKWIEFSKSYTADNIIYAASYDELFQSVDDGNAWKVIPRIVRYESHRGVIQYNGTWAVIKGDDYSATSISYSDVADSEIVFNFVGTGVHWISTKSIDQGIARVYIDGNHMADIDQFSETRKIGVDSFLIEKLPFGHHILTVQVTDTKTPESRGYRIESDAFDVIIH